MVGCRITTAAYACLQSFCDVINVPRQAQPRVVAIELEVTTRRPAIEAFVHKAWMPLEKSTGGAWLVSKFVSSECVMLDWADLLSLSPPSRVLVGGSYREASSTPPRRLLLPQ
ncbi:Unknown protein [Striga hermonthica]|uniref:Uncharacterized protein n=1 Tax=Striga hermonthica TaxID=68872 RepID=A0A9N7MNH3_STRHE|nr:Unknown protein [Striga hermonthica]